VFSEDILTFHHCSFKYFPVVVDYSSIKRTFQLIFPFSGSDKKKALYSFFQYGSVVVVFLD
jgi:hypothetical protein